MDDRVALQLLGPSTGGIRQHVTQLARGLPEVGWQAWVAAPAGVGEGTDLPPASVVAVPSGPNPLGALRARAALRPVAQGADLVHAHGLKAGWVAALAGTGLPLVVTVHNLVLDEAAGRSARVLRRLEGWLPSRADGVIAVSEEIAARFGGPSESLWVVPPAGPLPRPGRDAATVRTALGVALDAPLVVSVARL
ncbi:MAG: glycosyltransferase family 4 protein, partial [Acidimicrobiales bacterium]